MYVCMYVYMHVYRLSCLMNSETHRWVNTNTEALSLMINNNNYSKITFHTHPHLCPSPLLYLLSQPLLLFLFLLPSFLFLPHLQSLCRLPPLLLSPWTEEERTHKNRYVTKTCWVLIRSGGILWLVCDFNGFSHGINVCATSSFYFFILFCSTSDSPVLVDLALGLLLPNSCLLHLLLTLYSGLAFLMFAGLPPLNSLGMVWRQVAKMKTGNYLVYHSYQTAYFELLARACLYRIKTDLTEVNGIQVYKQYRHTIGNPSIYSKGWTILFIQPGGVNKVKCVFFIFFILTTKNGTIWIKFT